MMHGQKNISIRWS